MSSLAARPASSHPHRAHRRWVPAAVTVLVLLLAGAGYAGFAYYDAWVRTAPAQPTWAGPLTAAQRRQVFDALGQNIGRRYSYLGLKGVNWQTRLQAYWPRAEAAPDDQAFYQVLEELVASLHDGHTRLVDYPGKPVQTRPPVRLTWAEGQVVVTEVAADLANEVQPGDVVTAVNGTPVAAALEALRPRIAASSEAQLENLLAKGLLAGPAGSTITVDFRRPAGGLSHVALPLPAQGEPSSLATPPIVSSQRLGPYGYIKITGWTLDAVPAFDAALEQLRDTQGLILDVRGNGGGNDQAAADVAGRFLSQTTPWTQMRLRFAPLWSPVLSHEVKARGPWQYTGRLAVLIDGGVFSSNDFFVGGLVRSGRAVAVGTPTGGGSGNPIAVTLPGGAHLTISRWIEYFADGEVIEGNGTQPHISVAPTIADIAAGRDPVLERAIAVLAGGR